MNVNGKSIWITGASSGIGAALACKLADQGAQVAVSARREEHLLEVAAHAPERIHVAPLDVTDHDAVQETVGRLISELGGIDVAVLNAGAWSQMDALEWDHAAFRQQVEVNLLGTSSCLTALIPHMVGRRAGHLVGVSSVAGYRGIPGSEGYGATKAALLNLFEALRADLRPEGVLVQAVSPGFVRTDLTAKNQFPMPFIIEAEDAAEAIIKGMETTRPEIVFPAPMAVTMKLARFVPGRLWTRAWSKRANAAG